MITVDSRAKDFLTASEITRFLEAARKGRHGVRDYLLGLMAYRHGLRVTELIRIRLDDIDLDDGRMFVRRMKGSMSTSHPMQGDEVRAVRAWLRERKRFLPISRRGFVSNGDGKPGGIPSSSFIPTSGTDAARNGDGTSLELVHTPSLCTEPYPASGHQFSGSDGQNREVRHGLSDFSRHASGSELLFINEKRRPFGRTAINYLFHEIGVRAGIGHVHPHQFRHGAGYALANAGVPTRTIQLFLGHRDIQHTELYTQLAANALDGIRWNVR